MKKPRVKLDGAHVTGGNIGIDNQGGNLSVKGGKVKGGRVGMKLSGDSISDATGAQISGETAVEIIDTNSNCEIIEGDEKSLSFFKKAGVFTGNAIVPVLEWIKVKVLGYGT